MGENYIRSEAMYDFGGRPFWQKVVFCFSSLIFSLIIISLVHEVGHLLVALSFKWEVTSFQICFFPFGVFQNGSIGVSIPFEATDYQKVLFLSSGSLLNLFVGVIFLFLMYKYRSHYFVEFFLLVYGIAMTTDIVIYSFADIFFLEIGDWYRVSQINSFFAGLVLLFDVFYMVLFIRSLKKITMQYFDFDDSDTESFSIQINPKTEGIIWLIGIFSIIISWTMFPVKMEFELNILLTGILIILIIQLSFWIYKFTYFAIKKRFSAIGKTMFTFRLIVFGPIWEESIFRHLFYYLTKDFLSIGLICILSCLLFAGFHPIIEYKGYKEKPFFMAIEKLIMIFIFSIVFFIGYIASGANLLTAILLHSFSNIIAYIAWLLSSRHEKR